MSFGNFLRIERQGSGGSRHFVVHACDPRFTVELVPDTDPDGSCGRGVIRRVAIPNSWTGDYQKYGQLLGRAQDFFKASQDVPEPPSRL